jgi:hypothetical protein
LNSHSATVRFERGNGSIVEGRNEKNTSERKSHTGAGDWPPQRSPFTYIPPIHIMPIICPHYGEDAHALWHSPLPAGLKGEMRFFKCKDYGNEMKLIVNL